MVLRRTGGNCLGLDNRVLGGRDGMGRVFGREDRVNLSCHANDLRGSDGVHCNEYDRLHSLTRVVNCPLYGRIRRKGM